MISIVLVTYNRPIYLENAIKDILSQTFKDFELIICDDCSTNLETIAVIKKYQLLDKRISCFRQPYNIGMPENLNSGIKLAKHNYVAILHDSDRFSCNLLERWFHAIQTNDNIGFVFNLLSGFDNNGYTHTDKSYFSEGIVKGEYLLEKTLDNFKFRSYIWGEGLVRKDLVEKIGYLKKKYGFYADVDMWLELLQTNDAYFCDEPLIQCPSKRYVPRLFDDKMFNVIFTLMKINISHRTKKYKNIRLIREFSFFGIQSTFFYCYQSLVVLKHYNFASYWEGAKITYRNFPPFLLLWLFCLPAKCLFFKKQKNAINE